MVKHVTPKTGAKRRNTARGKSRPTQLHNEELLLAATIHLIRKVGGLFVATAVRKTGGDQWVITVTLRQPTGHEGYVGDLHYDGTTFTMLTASSLIDDRVRQIASHPPAIQQWHDSQVAALRPGKA